MLLHSLHSYCMLHTYFRGKELKEVQQMEGREQHLQSLGICRRLYNFIMRSLASQAFKSVTLGLPSLPEHAILNEAGTKCNRKEGNGLDGNSKLRAEEETEAQIPSIASRAKPPRKTVSINEEVEDIEKTLKLRRKSKSFEKLNSLELLRDEPEPLRASILKVGSDLSKKMAAFVNHNYN